MLEVKLISALDKVFMTGESSLTEQECITMPQNGRASVQVAFRCTEQISMDAFAGIRVQGWNGVMQVYEVGSVPCRLPIVSGQADALRTDAGFFPDVLRPLQNESCRVVQNHWQSIWLMMEAPASAGEQTVQIELTCGEECITKSLKVCVLGWQLPPQKLLATQWLHNDCIAQQHHVEMFSPAYWNFLEQYLRTAAAFGLNTILTPVFTPPLDTEVGSYRLNCQLTEVFLENGKYRFCFDRLDHWVDLCLKCGFTHFELSHLFTQWGAKAAPQIWAETDGEYRLLFGWDTPARSEQYQTFLDAFLPELNAHLEQLGIQDICFLHISDEPEEQNLEQYAACAKMIRNCLPHCKTLDAMSSLALYQQSGVDIPVVSLDHIQPFIDAGTAPLWGYYCWVQYGGVSNRYFSMPSAVTRIFGIQAYVYGLQGFLHWGYNFYNSFLSRRAIDPYCVTDADEAFPGGDAFSVYPTDDGCIPSVRLAVFADGLEDLRALQMLESCVGREKTLAFIEEQLGTITWTEYPRCAKPLLDFRTNLNLLCAEVTEQL